MLLLQITSKVYEIDFSDGQHFPPFSLISMFLLCDFAISLTKKLESIFSVPNFEFRQVTHLG